MSRPITKKVALTYLLGFHCAGARISEPQIEAQYAFGSTVEHSVGINIDPENVWSTNGGDHGSFSGDQENFVGYPPTTDKKATELTQTYDWSTGNTVSINIANSWSNNTLGLEAVSVMYDIYETNPKYTYSNTGEPNRMANGYYDCSSLVSRVYHQALLNLSMTDDYFVTGGYACNTTDLAKFLNNHNCLLYINDPEKTNMLHGMLPGDIIIRSKHYKTKSDKLGDRSKYKYETAHALMYVGNGKTLEIDGSGMHLRNFSMGGDSFDSDTSRVRFIGRPNIFYLGLKGISIPDSDLKPSNFNAPTTPDDYSYCIADSLIPA